MKYLILLICLPVTVMANIHSFNFYKHYEVTACFAKGEIEDRDMGDYVLKVREWKEGKKKKIIKWVNEEYSVDRTGIHFTGFLDCEEMPNADIVIFHNKNSVFKVMMTGEGLHGLAYIGPNLGKVKGYPTASGYVSISDTGMNKGTVTHEFGHAAGLAHEHLHPDAYASEKGRCGAVKPNQEKFWYYIYSPYDPHSVMNYCVIQGRGGDWAGLSEGDVKTLRKLYP